MKGLKKADSVSKNAEFIWVKSLCDTVNAYADFHEVIQKKVGARYPLYITADTDYALYVNGVWKEGGQYADYPDTYKVYDRLDITEHLAKGTNEILITIPCFGAVFSIQLWEYLLYSGDREFAAEMLPTAERILAGFLHRTDENGLQKEMFDRKYWSFYKWQKRLEGYEKRSAAEADLTADLPLCAFVSMAYQSLAKICGVLGNRGKEAEWSRVS